MFFTVVPIVRSAISLYLAVRGVKCTLLTLSEERFNKVVEDCPKAFRGNLVRTEDINVSLHLHVQSVSHDK